MKAKKGNRLVPVLIHIVLIFLAFLCLFFFYVLLINATHSHADLQKGFSALPGNALLENLKGVANDGTFPMFKGIFNNQNLYPCSISRTKESTYHGCSCQIS